mmetsp:Transcript_58990/g.166328  ORF Transcript_58990/g.166328 Transcript_58990/m.166328 type:complete len:198 (+) Transcript_58990:90-683(+)
MHRAFKALGLLSSLAFPARGDFRVRFDVVTDDGPDEFTAVLHEDWAPIGVERFKLLAKITFFEDNRFFRVVPGSVAGFGLNGDNFVQNVWNKRPIKDDPVRASNLRGRLTFANLGTPDSRSTELFINSGNNSELDSQGFAPIGEIEGEGMSVVDRLHNCGDDANRRMILSMGNKYLDNRYPLMSQLVDVTLIGKDEL